MTRAVSAASCVSLVIVAFLLSAMKVADNGPSEVEEHLLTATSGSVAPFEFPILVLADNNNTSTTSTTFTLSTTNVDQLFLYLNNVAYNGKGRVWLDNGTRKSAIVFRESSVAVCAFREAIEGCFANNSNRNHRALFDIPSDWKSGSNPLRAGENTLVFEMTVPSSAPTFIDHGHGYRVRWIDFVKRSDVSQNGRGLVTWWRANGKQLRFDNISSPVALVNYGSPGWKSAGLNGKLGNASAISRGKALYNARDLTGTRAACADCHASHGGDIELWNLENETIIEVARARGKSRAEGEDIAAYIRSFEWKIDGSVKTERSLPWCSPYQRGRSMITGQPLSETPVYLWAFGSCEVLDYDSDSASDFIAVLDDYEPGNVNKRFDYEDIPISLEYPSWHSWLPFRHVLDLSPGSESAWGPLLDDCLASARNNDVGGVINKCRSYTATMKADFNNLGSGSTQRHSVDNANGIRSQFMPLLEAMTMSGTDYQDRHDEYYDVNNDGVEPGCRSWTRMARTLFEPVGHLAGADGPNNSWLYSPIGDTRGEKWGNHAWYDLAQTVANSCSNGFSGTGPVDFGYQAEFFVNNNEGHRYLANILASVADMNKFNSSGGLAGVHGGLSAPGWTPKVSMVDYAFGDIYMSGYRNILEDVDTPALAAFFNKWFQQQKAILDAYTAIDPQFNKTCDPLPGGGLPTTDRDERVGGHSNAPCVSRGGQDGETKRYQWPNLDYQITISPSSKKRELSGPDHIHNHYRLLYRANATQGVDKDLLRDVARHYDNLMNSGNQWQNIVTGNTQPPPPPPSPNSQTINLLQGWNMVSSYIAPTSGNMSNVFSGIDDDIVLVKDGAGNQYHPATGLNTIGNWSTGDAYQVYASRNTALDVEGDPVDASTQISLSAGWNQIPYLVDQTVGVSTALQSIQNQITLVKDYAGRVYYPEFGIDEIGSLRPGQGYKLHASGNATLVYPSSGAAGSKTAGFDALGVASSATVVVDGPSYTDGMQIRAIGAAGETVGEGTVIDGKAVVRVVGDDALTETVVEGATFGEKISLVGTLPGASEEIDLPAIRIRSALEGGRIKRDIKYVEDAVLVVELDNLPQNVQLQQNFPNPFSESTSISYTLSRPGRVSLELFNTIGERVAVVVDRDHEEGSHSAFVDGSRLASGVYIYRLISDDTVEYRQMMLVK